eukprot:Anaeramoba_ignava/c21503_g1_i1.p1 GENE.c21503_g1_i1~~c21503_g1_i1.p1  ORF type:complete len:998 (+),score=320.50 c21503_g1_i1:72-3065(+)
MIYEQGVALFDYFSTFPSHLSFRRGEVIKITNKNEKLWHGTSLMTKENGFFPRNYVKITTNTLLIHKIQQQKRETNPQNTQIVSTLQFNQTKLKKSIQTNFSTPKKEKIQTNSFNLTPVQFPSFFFLSKIQQESLENIPIQKKSIVYKYRKSRKNWQKTTWQKRYLVLTKSTLNYYNNESTFNENPNEPRGSINLHQIIFVRTDNERLKKQNVFQVGTTSRVYFFKANSEDEANEWIITIKLSQVFLATILRINDQTDIPLLKLILSYLDFLKEDVNKTKSHFSRLIPQENKAPQRQLTSSKMAEINQTLISCQNLLEAISSWEMFVIGCLYKTHSQFYTTENQFVICHQKSPNHQLKDHLVYSKFDLIRILKVYQDDEWFGEINGVAGWFSPNNMLLLIPNFIEESTYGELTNQQINSNSTIDQFNSSKKFFKPSQKFIFDQFDVFFEGDLLVQEKKGKSVIWTPKWFAVSNFHILAFDSKEDPMAKRSFHIAEIRSITSAESKLGIQFAFQIILNSSTLYLCASDKQSMEKWIGHFDKLVSLFSLSNIFSRGAVQNNKRAFYESEVENMIFWIEEIFSQHKQVADKYQNLEAKLAKYQTAKKQHLNTGWEAKNLSFHDKLPTDHHKKTTNKKPFKSLIKKPTENFRDFSLSQKQQKENNLSNQILFIRQKIIATQNQISVIRSIHLYLLGISARFNFPRITETEIAYSLTSNISLSNQNELSFVSRQWFTNLEEENEKYLKASIGGMTGLIPRSKIIIVPPATQIIVSCPKNCEKPKYQFGIQIEHILDKIKNGHKLSICQTDDLKQFSQSSIAKSLIQNVIDDEQRMQIFPLQKSGYLQSLNTENEWETFWFVFRGWFFGSFSDKKLSEPIFAIDTRKIISTQTVITSSKKHPQFSFFIRFNKNEQRIFAVETEQQLKEWLSIFHGMQLLVEFDTQTNSSLINLHSSADSLPKRRTKQLILIIEWIYQMEKLYTSQEPAKKTIPFELEEKTSGK